MILLCICAVLTEVVFKPRLDFARQHVLLWFGRQNRKYIIIYTKHEEE